MCGMAKKDKNFRQLLIKYMTKIKKYIEIATTEIANLNVMTPQSCKMVFDVLKKHYEKVGVTVIKNERDLTELVEKNPDIVLSGIKYVGFDTSSIQKDSLDKIWFSEYLEERGILYTGSPRAALEYDLDKTLAKKKMQECAVNTAPFFLAQPNQFATSKSLPLEFPLFIKPIHEGGGNGIDANSVVNDFESYEKKIQDLFKKFKISALVEKYLKGREFTVGIIGSDYDNLIAMPIEIIAVSNKAGEKVRGAAVKEADTEKPIYIEDDKIRETVSEIAKNAFRSLGARDYGRIDIRMDEKGVPYFLEANLMPGMSRDYGDLSRSCRINNIMTYEEMILKVIELGLNRALPDK